MNRLNELFEDLQSSDTSVRFETLCRIEELGLPNSKLEEFKELVKGEQEQTLIFVIKKIIVAAQKSSDSKFCFSKFESLLNKAKFDEIEFSVLTESVGPAQAQLVAMSLRDIQWESLPDKVLPSVVRFFRKYGSYEDTMALERLCYHHNSRVVSSAIEALERLAPERLTDLIVPLLINSNVSVRSKAVRLLYKIDPHEALRHFEALLSSDSEKERDAAIFQAFFVPFESIKSIVLNFIGIENNAALLKKACVLLLSNPSVDVARKLLEIKYVSTGKRAAVLKKILEGVVESIYKCKIVNKKPAQIMAELVAEYEQKSFELYAERIRMALKAGTVQARYKAAIMLHNWAEKGQDKAKNMLDSYLKQEQDQQLREKIADYLKINKTGLSTKEKKSEASSEKPKTILEIINSADSNNFASVFNKQINAKLDASEIIALINMSEKFGSSVELEKLTKYLKHDNSEVVSFAIDSLKKSNPDILHPFLPTLLKHESDEVKLAALNVFALLDKAQAISLLEKMTSSIKPIERRQAVFCLVHLDFSSVFQVLLKVTRKEKDTDSLEQIANFFRLNASKELFFKLYSDWKLYPEQDLYEPLCKQIADSIAAECNVSTSDLYVQAADNHKQILSSKKQSKQYSVEKINRIRKKTEQEKTTIDSSLVRFTLLAYTIGAILTAVVWFGFLAP